MIFLTAFWCGCGEILTIADQGTTGGRYFSDAG
jgi:hypothetical protein